MARLKRDARLESREGRSKLSAQGEPYWRTLETGVALGYRKGRRGGVWIVRRWDGSKKHQRRLGMADDFEDADGRTILDYKAAYRAAIEKHDRAVADAASGADPTYTVAKAIQAYLEWATTHNKDVSRVELAAKRHILPKLGDKPVADLTATELRSWHASLLEAAPPPARRRAEGEPRGKLKPRTKSTANRIYTILRAALNRAYEDGKVASDGAWRRVKPFRNAENPRRRFLPREECRRLLNVCEPPFRDLVQGALVTGCRYGELCAMQVSDYHEDSGTVTVSASKSGKARHIPLTAEGVALFDRLTVGKADKDRIFTDGAGEPWAPHHQTRPMRSASVKAEIDPPASFHLLRHTYASHLALAGVPLHVIADVLGHADTRMTSVHYAHLMPSYIADTVRKHLPQFDVVEQKVKPLRAKRRAR